MSAGDLLLLIDLLGTFAFAANGGFTGARAAKLDIIGVLLLGTVTAIGGGVLRDVMIGATPPAAFTEWYYLVIATAGALLSFFVPRPRKGLKRIIQVLDAIGLSLFCVVGAKKALDYGLQPLPAVIMGATTAVGGGVLRDIIVRQVPAVLTSDLYAIPAAIGATVVVAGQVAGFDPGPFAIAGAVLCLALRSLGMVLKWQAPKPRRHRKGGLLTTPEEPAAADVPDPTSD